MKPLDQAIRDAFLEGIRRRGVASGEVWEYVKWLRYYLDFCEKYRREALDRESLQAFLLKLASKNQSAGQQDQAARSVGLYLELAVPRPVTPTARAPAEIDTNEILNPFFIPLPLFAALYDALTVMASRSSVVKTGLSSSKMQLSKYPIATNCTTALIALIAISFSSSSF